MALINCPECGNQVSDKAQFCVHCGYKLEWIRSQEESGNRITMRKEDSNGSMHGNQTKISQSSGGLKSGETSGLWDILPVVVMVLGCLGVFITLIEVVKGKSVLRDIPKLIISLSAGALVVIFEIFGLETLRTTKKVLAESMETLVEGEVTYEQKKGIGFILLVVGIAFVTFIVCNIISKKNKSQNISVAGNNQESKQIMSLKKNDDSMLEQNDIVSSEASKGKKQRKRKINRIQYT